ncbi:MAG: hypothetical protein DMG74_21905, partial [Acidobacteria bacterium]
HRYHIVGADALEVQNMVAPKDPKRGTSAPVQTSIGGGFRLQRVFNNRHIENLFNDFASIKFFLSRDHIREVLVIR